MQAPWNLIDTFLNDIAKDTGYDRDLISFEAELCNGGPTVHPNSAANKVISCTTAGPNVSLPSGWYDSIGSNHLEYRVIITEGKGDAKIPRVMHSFQHHPLAGCCRMGIQRWVRVHDDKWSDKLRKTAFEFRKAVAKAHGCKGLFVSSGPSGSGRTGELYGEFEHIFKVGSTSLYGILT